MGAVDRQVRHFRFGRGAEACAPPPGPRRFSSPDLRRDWCLGHNSNPQWTRSLLLQAETGAEVTGTQWLLWPPGVNVRSGICMGTGITPKLAFITVYGPPCVVMVLCFGGKSNFMLNTQKLERGLSPQCMPEEESCHFGIAALACGSMPKRCSVYSSANAVPIHCLVAFLCLQLGAVMMSTKR